MPVIVLAGDEDFELYRKLVKMRESLLDPQWASFNYLRIENPGITDVLDNALAVPFGPGNKVIVFDKCSFFTKKAGSKKDKGESSSVSQKQLDGLDDALSSVASNTYLIFACPFNFDTNLKLSKIVSKHAKLEEFPKAKYYVGSSNPKLETWVRREAKSFGATIDDTAIIYLLDGTEAHLRQISQELEKAATFILPKTHITYEVVVELSPHHSHVFTLLDHWLEGRADQALDSVNELLSRQPALQVIATLQTFLKRWIDIKTICDSANAKSPWGPGVSRRELPFADLVRKVCAELKAQPFMIEKDMRRLKNRSSGYLIQKRRQLTKFEYLIKSGQLNERNALELFLAS